MLFQDVYERNITIEISPGMGICIQVMSNLPSPFPELAKTISIPTSYEEYINNRKNIIIEKDSMYSIYKLSASRSRVASICVFYYQCSCSMKYLQIVCCYRKHVFDQQDEYLDMIWSGPGIQEWHTTDPRTLFPSTIPLWEMDTSAIRSGL